VIIEPEKSLPAWYEGRGRWFTSQGVSKANAAGSPLANGPGKNRQAGKKIVVKLTKTITISSLDRNTILDVPVFIFKTHPKKSW
jgi:hypothetical protein